MITMKKQATRLNIYHKQQKNHIIQIQQNKQKRKKKEQRRKKRHHQHYSPVQKSCNRVSPPDIGNMTSKKKTQLQSDRQPSLGKATAAKAGKNPVFQQNAEKAQDTHSSQRRRKPNFSIRCRESSFIERHTLHSYGHSKTQSFNEMQRAVRCREQLGCKTTPFLTPAHNDKTDRRKTHNFETHCTATAIYIC